jgi:hypothetical protein
VEPSSSAGISSHEYIAGPYGSGRLSLDGEDADPWPTSSTSCSCDTIDETLVATLLWCVADGFEDILEVPHIRHLLEPR